MSQRKAVELTDLIIRAKELELDATAVYLRLAHCAVTPLAQRDAMTEAGRAAIRYGREMQIENNVFTDFMWDVEQCKRSLQKAAVERVKHNR